MGTVECKHIDSSLLQLPSRVQRRHSAGLALFEMHCWIPTIPQGKGRQL
jgi:hypothetical protein